jgi:hypothetical protein
MLEDYHKCDVLPPHLPEYHDKVVRALEDDPDQHFIIQAGVPYLVDPEDIARELSGE